MKSIIKNEFKFKFSKNNIVELGFLRKFSQTRVYVSKKTGLVFHNEYRPSLEVVKEWSDNMFSKSIDIKKKKFSDNNPGMSARHFYVLELLLKFFGKKLLNNKIIDFGCGQGGLLLKAKKFYNFKYLYGSEHSKKNISLIYNNFLNEKLVKPKLQCTSIENINFKEKFDLGILTWTLCACSEPLEILKSISNNLKKNGHLIIAESSRILVPFKKPIFNYFNPKKKSAFTHPWHWSFNSLCNIFKLNGFELVYKNEFLNENDMVLIFKNSKNYNQKFFYDNPKKVVNFFKRWSKESLIYRNNI